ncbi:3'-5' exonuclease [Clostridium algidicarnis]|uniref:DNA polymerase-3 subunit epsilon n=1 Tax=Clostridium algidicarnis DSM 15099 TaxID=1121295 RepID=A0A2S6FZQ5_9CLOT|nr:3'-5' exonuclease [Clostridium algidicarnis]PPK49066.1 DNA polymerase-3 subunit epsilon [Clostridium algidicarnis DSM 15099]
MKLIFFDTETTDLRPGSICQLSYILVDTAAKPQRTIGKNIFFTVESMEPSAEKIHGFSLESLYELSGGLYFEDQYESFMDDFLSSDIVIGHNVNFDIKFLRHEVEGCGEEFNPKIPFCTMGYYKNICRLSNSRGDIKNPKLEEVIAFLNISKSKIEELTQKLFGGSGNYHDARFDTTATYLIVIEGIKKGFIPKQYFSNMLESKINI